MTMREYKNKAIEEQREWIEEHGGNLVGYIARYGDPNIQTHDGKEKFGEGGTAIYNADVMALHFLERR